MPRRGGRSSPPITCRLSRTSAWASEIDAGTGSALSLCSCEALASGFRSGIERQRLGVETGGSRSVAGIQLEQREVLIGDRITRIERQRSIESRPRGGRVAFRGLNRANEILRLPVPGIDGERGACGDRRRLEIALEKLQRRREVVAAGAVRMGGEPGDDWCEPATVARVGVNRGELLEGRRIAGCALDRVRCRASASSSAPVAAWRRDSATRGAMKAESRWIIPLSSSTASVWRPVATALSTTLASARASPGLRFTASTAAS